MPTSTSHVPRHTGTASCWPHRSGLAVVLWAGLTSVAAAKTCDEVKAEIAQRLDEAGLQGYSLEILPAGVAANGAKVVGHCGGSRKIAYRRFAAKPTPAAVSETRQAPVSPPLPDVAPPSPAPRREAKPPPAQPVLALAAPAQASMPTQPPAPQAPAKPEPTPPVITQPPVSAAVKPEAAPASQTGGAQAISANLGGDFLASHWVWLWAVLLLPLLAWVWRWRAGAVDAAGLPRGPRL